MIKLRVDSRNKRWSVAKTFGKVLSFPDEFVIKDTIPDYVQPVGDTKCVSITCCDIASDKDDLQYDFNDLYNRFPHNENGAIPNEGLSETVKNGLLPVGQTQRIKVFNSYYSAHTGERDSFDEVRSSLLKIKYPVAVWTNWYSSWNGQTILSLGENPVSGHMYNCEGYKIINSEPMLIIEAWLGHKIYMSREVFNRAVSEWGCGTAVLSTLQLDIDRRKTILEAIKDTIQNIILWIGEQIRNMSSQPPIVQPQPSQPQPAVNQSTPEPKKDLLTDFCSAIATYEGGPGDLNHKNNNAGNIRGKNGKFLKFATWEIGFEYLKEYVRRVGRNEHKAYPKDCNIKQFFAVYAPATDSNHPDIYSSWIANRIGVPTDFKIKDLV